MASMWGGQLQIGVIIGGYRIDELISRGGMGVVYRVTHDALNKVYALKVLAPELAEDAQYRERFKREMRIAASLNHRNVVGVHYAGEHEGLLFFVMDYITGTDLREVLRKQGALNPRRAVDLLGQLASALDAAHSRGLVHRDVKPGNILITVHHGDENAYLTDFGLARKHDTASGLTRKGLVVGTVDYMAPEQITGDRIDARTDIYALGCVFYQMLTGVVPYERDNSVATLFAQVHDPPPPLQSEIAQTHPQFAGVLATAMAKDPNDRYLSAGDFAADAEAALAGSRYGGPPTVVASGEATPAPPETASPRAVAPDDAEQPERDRGDVLETPWVAAEATHAPAGRFDPEEAHASAAAADAGATLPSPPPADATVAPPEVSEPPAEPPAPSEPATAGRDDFTAASQAPAPAGPDDPTMLPQAPAPAGPDDPATAPDPQIPAATTGPLPPAASAAADATRPPAAALAPAARTPSAPTGPPSPPPGSPGAGPPAPAQGPRRRRRLAGLLAAVIVAVAAVVIIVASSGGSGKQAAGQAAAGAQRNSSTLSPVPDNRVKASGSATVALSGNTVTVTLDASGLLNGSPHAMHIHAGGLGECPPASAARRHNGHLAIDTKDGIHWYGPPQVSLTDSGDTLATSLQHSVLAFARYPSVGNIRYHRTFSIPPGIAAAIRNHNAVIVVHGIDYNHNGLYDDVLGQSQLNPGLPSEATAPALCGPLVSSASGSAALPGHAGASVYVAQLHSVRPSAAGISFALLCHLLGLPVPAEPDGRFS